MSWCFPALKAIDSDNRLYACAFISHDEYAVCLSIAVFIFEAFKKETFSKNFQFGVFLKANVVRFMVSEQKCSSRNALNIE